jgi:hypothetical protein
MIAEKNRGRGVRHNPHDPMSMNTNYNENWTLMSRENLKCEVGELLFCLELPIGCEFRQLGWALFERLLRRYVGLNYTSKGVSEPLESSNVDRRVSG